MTPPSMGVCGTFTFIKRLPPTTYERTASGVCIDILLVRPCDVRIDLQVSSADVQPVFVTSLKQGMLVWDDVGSVFADNRCAQLSFR